jgi:coenzyme F420-reducing hydrogenase beta subunit
MRQDDEGFYYPEIDTTKCINCGLCNEICPISGKQLPGFECAEIFACQNRNDNIRKISTSGGIFAAIASKILNMGGSVWAVGFDKDLTVIHKKATSLSEMDDMYGSKYVQSELRETFNEIKQELKKNEKPLLFVGTPCQVEGLLHYVGTDNGNLFTIDLVCYGVPSPKLYKKWIETIERKHKKKIKCVYFRDKKYGYAGVNIKIAFTDDSFLEDRIEVKTFCKTMFSHIGLRPSCYECPFRGRKRKCDFTLGDLWEIGDYSTDMDDNKGTTKLQIYSEKGMSLFEAIRTDLIVCHMESLVGDRLIEKLDREKYSISMPAKREMFFKDSNIMDYEELIDKYLPTSIKEQLAIWLKPVILKTPISESFFRALKKLKAKRFSR